MTNEPTPSIPPPPRKARTHQNLRNLRRAYRSIFALIIFVFTGWAALDGWRLYELSYGTVTANAIITKKTIVPSGIPRASAGQADYRLEYTFAAEGTSYTDAASVAQDVYEAAVEGGRATVVYLPGNPGTDHWLGDNESARAQPRFMLICRSVAAILALLVLIVIEQPLRAEVWLARHGVVVQGQILATGQGRRKRSKPWIKYVFCTADGAMVEGRSFLPRVTPKEVLVVGRPIEVLYDPRRPRRNKARLAMSAIEFGV